MERFLFAKVEVWSVIVLFLLGCLAVVGFGAAVLDAERDIGRYGTVSAAALAVAEIPDTARTLVRGDNGITVYSNTPFDGKPTGWSFPAGPMNGPTGYLLFSRYDGTRQQHTVELLSMPDMMIRHSWELDVDRLMAGVNHVSPFSDHQNWTQNRFRVINPLLTANGDMIVKDHYSPLFRVDPCGQVRWTNQSQVFHHSTEADTEGNYWIPSLAEHHSLNRIKDSFREDMVTLVSPHGKILHNESVAQILMRNGYTNWLFSNEMYKDDPTHLNDIEPVLADGPYWKKGDVFLSLRNVSTIMLYRPTTGAIVWMKRGPWLSQHDVDIIDDHRISIYDNNAQDRGKGGYVDGNSHMMIYDFSNGKVGLELEQALKANTIRTTTAGLFTRLSDGSTMVEDVTNARFLILRPDGQVAAEYVNRAADGDIYHLGWSRFLDKKQGEAILSNIGKVKCNA